MIRLVLAVRIQACNLCSASLLSSSLSTYEVEQATRTPDSFAKAVVAPVYVGRKPSKQEAKQVEHKPCGLYLSLYAVYLCQKTLVRCGKQRGHWLCPAHWGRKERT